jgi:hypothetical protein
MKGDMGHGVGRGMGLALALLAGAGRAAAPTAAPLTAPAYRQAMAPVESCAAFGQAYPVLPDARPLLRHLFDTPLAAKRADESDDAFMNRAVKQLFGTLGDPSRLHLRLDVGALGRYDAGAQVMAVPLPAPWEAVLDHWGRRELRIRGGAPLVTQAELRAQLDFTPPPAALLLPMAPADAARFATDGRLELLALFDDYGTDASHRDAAAGAAATQTSYRLVRMRPKCALVTLGDHAVAGWRYDQWDGPAE